MGSVDDEQVGRYLTDGYLVVHGLVDDDTVADLGREAARFARGEYKVVNPPDLTPGATDDEAMRRLLAVHFPHWVSPVVRSVVDAAPLAEAVRRLAGAHIAGWDGSAKCMQTMLFVKGPGMPGQAWHQDERFIPTRDRSLVGAWIALDDATIANGCLEVIPGSHRPGYIHPFRPHDDPAEFDPADEAYGFDPTGAVPVEVPAGGVVFFNGYLLHRSRRNRSDGYRRALVNHYCTAATQLPWAALPEELSTLEVATKDYRNVVPLGPDPYEWKGYGECPDFVFVRPAEGPWV